MIASELLPLHLSCFVPFRIREIQDAGGATEEDFSRVIPFATELGAKGDHVLYRNTDTAGMVGRVVDAVAVLSFCPGGIDIFGLHFEAETAT